MRSEGYAEFDGVKCIYLSEKNSIKLIPCNKNNLKKLYTHHNDHDFLFGFSEDVYANCIAYIDHIQMHGRFSIDLSWKFLFKLANANPITEMHITGEAIDEMFHPASYFYEKHMKGIANDTDLVYENEIADDWQITIEDSEVNIILQYGSILGKGIASDMMLHPQLIVRFEPVTDISRIYRIYSVVERFLRIIQFNSSIGRLKVELHGRKDNLFNFGRLYVPEFFGEKKANINKLEYVYLESYIQQLLQFSADNSNMSLDFLPDTEFRWLSKEYTPQIITRLFAAFESEYKANSAIYEKVKEDTTKIKDVVLCKIQECYGECISSAEKAYLEAVKLQILNFGNQPGQRRKIKNVLSVVGEPLKTSIGNLLMHQDIKLESGYSNKAINTIAECIVGLRSQASHDNSLMVLGDEQTEYIHFLEVLIYVQMLKRAKIDDDGIELLIGLLFGCNSTYLYHIADS